MAVLSGKALGVAPCLIWLAVGLFGCDSPRQVPRIEPNLANWVTPYRGSDGLRLHIFNTGSMSVPAAAVYRGGSVFERRRLDIPAFVVEHPRGDLVVFDTGLSALVREDPEDYLGWPIAGFDLFEMPSGAELDEQMRRAGLRPEDARYVVLSHLHFDHTGAIRAFENATVVTARGEKQKALAASGLLDYFREQDWEGLGPWVEIDYEAGEPYATFASHHDLLGDGSVVLVDLRGHTGASQGMLLLAGDGPILLTGDAAYVDESWRYAALPLMADDMDAWWTQIWRVKKLAQIVPELLIVPGHDLSKIGHSTHADVIVHDFESDALREAAGG